MRHENDLTPSRITTQFYFSITLYIFLIPFRPTLIKKNIFLFSFLFIEKQTVSYTYAKKSKRYVLDVFFSLYL